MSTSIEENRQKQLEYGKRYRMSKKGKAAIKRYNASAKAKAARRRYLESAEGKSAQKRYRESDKGKAVSEAYVATHKDTPEWKAYQREQSKRYYHRNKEAGIINYWQTPRGQEIRKLYSKEYFQRPGIKERAKKRRMAQRDRINEKRRQYRARPDVKARRERPDVKAQRVLDRAFQYYRERPEVLQGKIAKYAAVLEKIENLNG